MPLQHGWDLFNIQDSESAYIRRALIFVQAKSIRYALLLVADNSNWKVHSEVFNYSLGWDRDCVNLIKEVFMLQASVSTILCINVEWISWLCGKRWREMPFPFESHVLKFLACYYQLKVLFVSLPIPHSCEALCTSSWFLHAQSVWFLITSVSRK